MPTIAKKSRLTTVLEMIKFEHTIFALPFALLGAVLAAAGMPAWRDLGWIVVAMVGARSAAMGFNRLVDRKIDAANPRTADRALPAGAVSPGFVAGFVVASCALLVLAAWQLNPLALRLSPIAGFDTLYALQDVDYDRDVGLHSIPARFGVVPALWISTGMHVATLGLLAFLPRLYAPVGVLLGPIYWLGWLGCFALLAYQHWVVRPGDLSRLNAAFFQSNGLLAVWYFAMTSAAIWWSVTG